MLTPGNYEASLRRKIRPLVLLILLICSVSNCSGPPAESSQSNAVVNAEPNAATVAAAKTSDAGLDEEINHLIDAGQLAAARWGVSVISLKDNRVLFERNADRLFTPASNMKLFPTAAALELLGADFRWRTSAYATTTPDGAGTVNGDLVLYGRGAPDLTQARPLRRPHATDNGGVEETDNSLDHLAAELFNRGVRRIKGNVVGDESYFRGDPIGSGWQWNDVQWYFGAEASALTVNANEISISVLPPDKFGAPPVIRVSDTTGYVTVENEMAIGAVGDRMTLGIQRGLSNNIVRVWGTFPSGSKGFGARLSVHRPALWASRLFVESLKAHGITVEGQALARDSRTPIASRFNPQQAHELAFVSSKPLRDIIKLTNKFSINLYAELILRTLGRERSALLSAPEPSGRESGDDETGLAIIRLWLNRSKVETEGLALHDGSGLSRLNLVTPRSIALLLATLQRSPNGQIFRDSLPLAGRDGTLGSRLSEYADRVSAKTGYLTYDTSLSGYVNTSQAEVLAFSIICNDDTGRASSGRVIDQIVSLLASYPHRTSKKAP